MKIWQKNKGLVTLTVQPSMWGTGYRLWKYTVGSGDPVVLAIGSYNKLVRRATSILSRVKK